MKKYYLAIDIGASSGRHILGSIQNGKLVLEEIYRFRLKDLSLAIPEAVMSVEAIDRHENKDEWLSNGEFYFTQGIYMRPRQGSKGFPKINFQKIFGSGKKQGITFTLTCIYQFDGGTEKTIKAEYDVSCFDGRYIPPFF